MAVESFPGLERPSQPSPQSDAIRRFTLNIEWLAWAAVLVVGALLRLPSLSDRPPSTVEAVSARAAWEVAQGSAPSGWPGDLQSALAALLIRLGGDGIFWVRLGPALCGLAAVAALALFRPYAGRALPWLAALLLAVAPLAVSSARALSPDPAALVLGLALLWCVLRVSEDGDARALPVLGLVAGLSLAAGSVALALALVAGLWLAVEIAWLRRRPVADCWQRVLDNQRGLVTALLLAAPGLALGVIRFGAGPNRLALPAFTDWSGPIPDGAPSVPWHAPLAWLVAYEPLALVLGAAGAYLLLRRWIARGGGALTPFERLLLVWAVAGLVLGPAALHDRPGQGLVVALPLMLLAAHVTLDRAAGMTSVRWRYTGPLLLPVGFILVFALMRLVSWADAGTVSRNEGGGLIVLAIFAVALTVFALYQSPAPAWGALPVVVAWPLLGLTVLHGTTSIAFGDGLELTSGQQAMPQREAVVRGIDAALAAGRTVAVERPVAAALAWEVRGRPVTLFIGLPPAADTVVRSAQPATRDGYVPAGPVVAIERRWYPPDWTLAGLLRWSFYRQPREVESTITVELLQRVDAAR